MIEERLVGWKATINMIELSGRNRDMMVFIEKIRIFLWFLIRQIVSGLAQIFTSKAAKFVEKCQ